MLELPEDLSTRSYRLQASYTAARLNALEETRHLARDFEEAADKFAVLEGEEAQLAVRRMQTQAAVETADDAWDDTMIAFRQRLLERAGHDTEAAIYRRYFADIPSNVTSLSYAAEILISKELEAQLAHEEDVELSSFADRLADKRVALEAIIRERTQLEVEEARFANRVALAKQVLNKLRRVLFASLEEVQMGRGRDRGWCARFYHSHNDVLAALDADGVEAQPVEVVQVVAEDDG
jgi:hypothetical protein